MNDFGVKSTQLRKGIGRSLLHACIEWAKKKGATSLELNVWEFNKSAISFYQSIGFETISG
ncbi:GNAT family N-acetyltransferase [Fredinandcohnia humi]